MTSSRPRLARLFPAAALVAAVALPMTACAQTPIDAPKAQQAAEAPAKPVKKIADEPGKPVEKATSTDKAEKDNVAVKTEKAADKKEKKKTPEELAAEKEQKELKKLQLEAQLRAARLAAELAPMMEKKKRIEAEIALLTARQQQEQAQANLKKNQADFESQLKLAGMMRDLQAMQQQYQKMQLQMQVDAIKNQAKTADLAAENAKLSTQAMSLQAQLALVQTQRAAKSVDKKPMTYPTKPLEGKVLTISDRRIPLNDSIARGTASYVTERIHYFNNLDTKAPIFIVIDSSPGGSVMEGYRIVTAMQNSKAPVHVVVKSYAASMAAVITTLAEESYTYPNAVILHHQMSSGMRGNLTQQAEWLEEGKEWARRLADPVAKKMGVTNEEFTKLMYKNNSDGDWAEFGDKAQKLKWVNHVVEEIRETALVTAPTAQTLVPMYFQADGKTPAAAMPRAFTQDELFKSPIKFETKIDGNGKAYTELPALQPYDFYFLHDPDQRYRIAK